MSWTINSKTSKTSPVDTDSFPIAESGNTVKRVTLANLYTYLTGKFPTLAHGTYTPTLTGVTNIASSSAGVAQYLRVGNTVTVSGTVTVALTTGSAASELGVSLPIASNLTALSNLGGCAAQSTAGVWAAYADSGNDRAKFQTSTVTVTSSQTYAYTFTYVVQ